jgi:hypothetical protein
LGNARTRGAALVEREVVARLVLAFVVPVRLVVERLAVEPGFAVDFFVAVDLVGAFLVVPAPCEVVRVVLVDIAFHY